MRPVCRADGRLRVDHHSHARCSLHHADLRSVSDPGHTGRYAGQHRVCVVYLLLGAVGLPVFSGFRGGMGVLLGVTGGYIWGFLATALIYWYVTRVFGNSFRVQILAMVLGLIACYALGSGWFMLVYLKGAKSITLWAVLTKCVIPFILPDLAKLSLALVLGKRLQPMLR